MPIPKGTPLADWHSQIGGGLAAKPFTPIALELNTRLMSVTPPNNDAWRWSHMGRLLGESLRRFDERVMTLMAHSAQAPLSLANLASRGKVSAAIIHITRHLPVEGARLTWLASQAGISKQAMATLIDDCEAWDLVARESDPQDARAKRVVFTAAGLEWLKAFELAVDQAERELRQEMGEDIARVVAIGLESYARSYV